MGYLQLGLGLGLGGSRIAIFLTLIIALQVLSGISSVAPPASLLSSASSTEIGMHGAQRQFSVLRNAVEKLGSHVDNMAVALTQTEQDLKAEMSQRCATGGSWSEGGTYS